MESGRANISSSKTETHITISNQIISPESLPLQMKANLAQATEIR